MSLGQTRKRQCRHAPPALPTSPRQGPQPWAAPSFPNTSHPSTALPPYLKRPPPQLSSGFHGHFLSEAIPSFLGGGTVLPSSHCTSRPLVSHPVILPPKERTLHDEGHVPMIRASCLAPDRELTHAQ